MTTGTSLENDLPSASSGPLPTILVVGRFHTEGVARHIAESLETLGHGVERFETSFRIDATGSVLRKRVEQVRSRVGELAGSFPIVRKRFADRLLTAARARPIDLTLVCHDFLRPDEVRRLKDVTGAPAALWYPDHIGNFGRSWFLNADYDALFFKDPFIVHTLGRNLDKPIFYLPECHNPNRHEISGLSDEELRTFGCDIATAGNMYAYRAEFFAQLRDYDVKIWGNPPPIWMNSDAIRPMIQGRYVANEDKARAFLGAKIVVNNLYPAEVWGINARAFEIAGIGGFQLLDWRPGLDALFEDGREVVSFRSMPDLREKIDYYLPREEERREIAERGRLRAHRDHSFQVRLPLLVETALGRAQGHPMPDVRYVSDG